MRRLLAGLATTGLVLGASSLPPGGAAVAADTAPLYYVLPSDHSASSFAVTADGTGAIWLGAAGPLRGSQPTPSLARLDPTAAVAGTAAGITTIATPDPASPGCCANQLRSVTYNSDDGRVYYVRSDGGFGSFLPASPAGSLTAGSLGDRQDLWDVAPATGGGAWFTERSASNTGSFPGSRIARLLPGGSVQEGPNIAVQGSATQIDSSRYDAQPSGITLDRTTGKPWFVEENPGLPGYRIATYGGGTTYQEYLAAPCAATSPCSGSNTGTGLTDAAVAADGSIWFTNVLKHTFGRFDPVSGTVTQYALSSVSASLASADPRQVVAAPDGTLWLTVSSGGLSSPKALVRVVPGTGTAAPTATFTSLGANAPLGITATATDIWFGFSNLTAGTSGFGRLAGVVGSSPGGGTTPGTGSPTGTPPTTTPAATGPAVVLAPVATGRTTLDPPQSHNGEINTNQVCVGPPQAQCSVVYLVREHEYTTGFRAGTTNASPRAGSWRKPARRPKPRKLAGRTVVLQGGQSTVVTLRLNGLGRRILAARGRIKVDVVATERLGDGSTRQLSTRTLTVKAPKRGR